MALFFDDLETEGRSRTTESLVSIDDLGARSSPFDVKKETFPSDNEAGVGLVRSYPPKPSFLEMDSIYRQMESIYRQQK